MAWTKRQFVEMAFSEIGLASFVYDLQPEQLDNALRRLDSMLASWNARGIRLGYPIPSNPQDSDLDDSSNVPDSANEAIYTNLGIALAPAYGKTVSPDTKIAAKMAYDTLLSRAAATPLEMQFPGTLPVGAGNKPYNYDQQFFSDPSTPILTGDDGDLQYD